MALHFLLDLFLLETSLLVTLSAEVCRIPVVSVSEGRSCLSQQCSSLEQMELERGRLAVTCTVSAFNLLREANPEPYPSEQEIKGLNL